MRSQNNLVPKLELGNERIKRTLGTRESLYFFSGAGVAEVGVAGAGVAEVGVAGAGVTEVGVAGAG
jgi:hypothetical protein